MFQAVRCRRARQLETYPARAATGCESQRAINSFPVPDSPRIKTVELDRATLRIIRFDRLHLGRSETISVSSASSFFSADLSFPTMLSCRMAFQDSRTRRGVKLLGRFDLTVSGQKNHDNGRVEGEQMFVTVRFHSIPVIFRSVSARSNPSLANLIAASPDEAVVTS